MSDIIRCGVVGLGKMGLLHSALVNVINGSALRAVCEPGSTIRNGFETFVPGVPVYKDCGEMLKAGGLDAVFIATPPSSHVEIATACLRQGCHVFIEKPLSLTAEDAKPLVKLIQEAGKVGMVGFMMRYAETFARAREIVAGGALGKIIACRGSTQVSQIFKAGKGWRYSRKESGGGVLIAQGIHAVDLMCWMMGMPRSVHARRSCFYSRTVEDFFHATLAWGEDTFGWLDSSWSVDGHRMMETRLELTGENGSLAVDDDAVRVFLRKSAAGLSEGWTSLDKPELSTGVAADIGGPQYTRQDEAFIRAIRNKGAVESDVRNACRVQHVVDCLYRSADSDGMVVKVEESL